MGLKSFLVLMTILAVLSDSLLHPFYPHYFAAVFGTTDPFHIGAYIASSSLTVMLAFPFWARIARRVPVLRLLVFTQLAAAALSLACSVITSLPLFWLVSLLMLVFKASYLLIYPYVMSLEEKSEHIGTISLLALIVYFGHILAALLSGVLMQLVDARLIFVVMACGDIVQTILCGFRIELPSKEAEADAAEEKSEELGAAPSNFIYKLGAVMFLMYFSAYITEPFFAVYWETVSESANKILSGAVFAIPGLAAILGLYLNASQAKAPPETRREGEVERNPHAGIVGAIALGIGGLMLQLSAQLPLLLVGRFLYGWALFQSMVRLDALLFRQSSRGNYSVDFSKINIFQALGIQAASFAAGSFVFSAGLRLPLLAAAGGFIAGAALYLGLFRKERSLAT